MGADVRVGAGGRLCGVLEEGVYLAPKLSWMLAYDVAHMVATMTLDR